MDGGTCESSAYCTLGFEATGLCLALGNYHNVDVKRKKLGPECIDLSDFDNVVKWFVALARAPSAYTGRDDVLRTTARPGPFVQTLAALISEATLLSGFCQRV